jgi:SSS family solute:Na+ symporter
MTFMHVAGAVLVLVFITALGLYSGKKVKTSSDFSGGAKTTGAGVVAGAIIGTLVGGASTIGTAQLAFNYGFSAWWFTLGGGIGVLLLGLFFDKTLYNSGVNTLPQFFRREFGQSAGVASTLLTSMGSFLSIVSQMLSGIALVAAVMQVRPLAAAGVIVLLMLAYVVFGGVWGAGLVGVAKTALMYGGLAALLVVAVSLQGGFGAFGGEALPAARYFNLFARGAVKDLGAGLSLVVGVLTTQTYLQAAMSARSLRTSRAGCALAAFLIPLMGIPGIYVGMYMKANEPGIAAAEAMPQFIMEHTPPIVAGAVLAVLLVALVGTGAGLALGLSSMITGDIYKAYINKAPSDRRTLVVSRAVIVAILVCAALFSFGKVGDLILGWSFLSMALRGAVAFVPLCAALFLPGRVGGRYALAAMVAGPALVILGNLIPAWPSAVDPLFLGMAGALAIMAAGLVAGKPQRRLGGAAGQA